MTRWNKIARDTTGAEIAEAALVLPIFFMILLGIYWFGMAFNTYATINRAAMAGARAAVAQSCAACTPLSSATVAQNAANQVTAVMQASNVNINSIHVYSPASTACPNTTVSCNSSNNNISVCTNVQVQSTTPAGGGNPACGVSVSFQYPYKFFLPFTSLNMQQITLSANAQMKQEY